MTADDILRKLSRTRGRALRAVAATLTHAALSNMIVEDDQ